MRITLRLLSIIIICIGLIVQPVFPVVATEQSIEKTEVVNDNNQQVITLPENTSNESPSDEEINSQSPGIEPLTENEQVPIDPASKRDNGGLKPQQNVGNYNVDEFNGAFNYSFPIEIPTGRNKLQPTLALNYNHQRSNLGSFVGYGWDIPLPMIERVAKSGVDNLYTDNSFKLTLSGSQDLVPISVDGSGYGTYGKQIEDTFEKIEYSNSGWLVTDTLGTQYTFGSATSSRQDDPTNPTKIFKWLLTEMRDTNDNFVRYEYFKDNGQIYPKKIVYTGHGSDDGINEVHFQPFVDGNPVENNILSISYATGFKVQTKYLLSSIEVWSQGEKIRSYDLTLTNNSLNTKKLLTAIQPKAFQNGQEFTKDNVSLSYMTDSPSFSAATNDYTLPNGYKLGENVSLAQSKRDMFLDLDQDGLADYIRISCQNGAITLDYYKNNGTGGWASASAYDLSLGTGYTCNFRTLIPVAFGEINGDRRIDLITQNSYFINTETGWQQQAHSGLPVMLQSTSSGSSSADSVSFIDMNRDGYDDIVYLTGDSPAQEHVYIRIPGDGYALDNDYDLSITPQHGDCFLYGGSPYGFADINSDGLTDIFYNYSCTMPPAISETRNGIFLNTGSGLWQTYYFSSPALMSYYSQSSTIKQRLQLLSDYDGDGIIDGGTYERWKWTTVTNTWSQGFLNMPGGQVFNTDILGGDGYFTTTLPIAIADLNGDQSQDVMHATVNWGSGSDVFYGSSSKADVLKKVEYQDGSNVFIKYGFSALERNTDGSKANPQLLFNLHVVKDVVVGNGLDKFEGSHYDYSGGVTASYPSEKIHDMHGFATVKRLRGNADRLIDRGTGEDGAFVSSGNETWTSDKNFTSIHILSGHTITVEPNVTIKIQGQAIIDGVLSADGMGYDGANSFSWGEARQGYGPGGGQGGQGIFSGSQKTHGGGGAGYANTGGNGQSGQALGGISYGSADLKDIDKGSGGGSTAELFNGNVPSARGGDGGGIVQLSATDIVINGEVSADGMPGQNGNQNGAGSYFPGGAGGGSGGSIYLRATQSITAGNNKITVTGGAGGIGTDNNNGGTGSVGRIRLESPFITGVTSPAYYSSGEFEYSVLTSLETEDRKLIEHQYAVAQGNNTSLEESYFLHGKNLRERELTNDNYLEKQKIWNWQQQAIGSNRKFVSLQEEIGTDVHLLEEGPLQEYELDGNTMALYHMDGAFGTLEKADNAQGNSSYDLDWAGPLVADVGFNGEAEGSYSNNVENQSRWLNTGITSLGSGPFTIELWVKHIGTQLDNKLFGKVDENDRGFYAEYDQNQHRIFWESGNDTYSWTVASAVNSIDLNAWHHYAFVMDGTKAKIYIDGDLSGESNVAYLGSPSVSRPLIFLCTRISPCNNGNRLTIDEMRVSNTARSAQEIYDYYHNTQEPYFETSQAKRYTYDATNGNLLTETNLGNVTAEIVSGTITNELPGDEKTTTYAYAQNSGKHILSAAKTQILTGYNATKDQDLYYDGLALGSVDKVNVTKEDLKVNAVDIETTYNDFGLALTKKDPKDNTAITLTYDTANLYISTSTDALGRQTITLYDPRSGNLLYSRDPNGYQEQFTYDAFNRPTRKEISDPTNPTNLIIKQEITYTDGIAPRSVEIKDYFAPGRFTVTREYYDGLGRVVESKRSTATASQFITIAREYDSQGRVKRESLPYITSSLNYEAGNFVLAKSYTYDAQDRILTETTPTGVTTYEYDGLVTSITDPRGKLKKLTKDAFDNLIKVEEFNSGSTYTTTYEYSLTNKLKKITDAQGNIRTFTYDALDNLTQQDMVHKPSVSNPVKWTYTYDKNGNVLSKVDPKSQTVNYTYDLLNRLTQENFTGKAGVEYALTYDQGSGQLGRLTQAVSSDGVTISYTYDISGRPLSVSRTIDGQTFVLTFSYDWNGNITSITYPEGERVDYIYNDAGQISQVNKVKNNQTTVLAQNISYSPLDQIVHLERGNGVVTDYTYDPAQSYRLTRLQSVRSGTVLQDINYTYDANGNILTLTEASATALAKNASYTYDDLNRLTSVTVTNAASGTNYTHSYTYDAIGNILTSDAGTYTYNNNNPHQANNVGGTSYTYDTNGNVKYIGQDFMKYDFRDRMDYSRRYNTADYTEYLYDHTNQRVKKHTVVYVAPPGGGDCENHPDDCPDPILGIPRVISPEPVPTPAPGKLPIPVDASIEAGEVLSSNNEVLNNTEVQIPNTETGTEITIQAINIIDEATVEPINDEPIAIEAEQVLTAEPVEIMPLATSTDEVVNPDPVESDPIATTTDEVINLEPIATSTDEVVTPEPALDPLDTATTTEELLLSVEEITPNAAPSGHDIATYYIDKYYQKTYNGSGTNFYFLGNIKLATDNLGGTNTGVYYTLSDHLGSSSLITNPTGTITEASDYKPFGSIAYESITTNIGNNYKYTGKEADSENSLSYFGARYYNQANGRFTSIDSVSLALVTPQLKVLSGRELPSVLHDPQLLNGYSYTANNPIRYIDPDGNFLDVVADVGFIGYDIFDIGRSLVTNGRTDRGQWLALGADVGGAFVPFGTGFGIVARTAVKADDVADAAKVIKGVDNAISSANKGKYIDNIDDIIPPSRQKHILEGEPGLDGGWSGGHRAGTGKGKPEFPSSWSDQQILHNGADIATDPASKWVRQNHGNFIVRGIRDNFPISVVVDKTKSIIVTIFPWLKK